MLSTKRENSCAWAVAKRGTTTVWLASDAKGVKRGFSVTKSDIFNKQQYNIESQLVYNVLFSLNTPKGTILSILNDASNIDPFEQCTLPKRMQR